MRSFLAVLVGLFVGVGLVFGIEMVGHTVYPPPADLDYQDQQAMTAFVASLPVGAFAFVLAAWILGAFGGATVAGRVSRAASGRPALIVGALLLAATVANLASIPHPTWVAVAGLGGIVIATAVAVRQSRRAARPG